MNEKTRYARDNAQEVNEKLRLMFGTSLTAYDQLLCPVPMGIAYLGQLMIVAASKEDFSIDHHRKKFERIKHPESFKACLHQICKEHFSAFNKAHNNMFTISLQMQNIQKYVHEVSTLLGGDDLAVAKNIFPLRLKSIQEATDKSLKLSKEIDDDFSNIRDLIAQVIDATMLSRMQHENARQDHEKVKKLEEEKQRILREELERKLKKIEDLKERERKEISNRQNAFEVANEPISLIQRIPSWLGVRDIDARRREEARELMEKSTAQLEKVKAEVRQTEQEIDRINKEILASWQNMQNTKLTNFSAEDIVRVLEEGLKNLGELTTQWGLLTTHLKSFNIVIEQVDTAKFIETAELASEDKKYMESMVDSTLVSRKYSYLIHYTAEMYYEVSGCHIIGSIANLGRMITASRDIEEARQEIMDTCEKASKGIADMILESQGKLIKDIEHLQNEMRLQTLRLSQE